MILGSSFPLWKNYIYPRAFVTAREFLSVTLQTLDMILFFFEKFYSRSLPIGKAGCRNIR